MKQFWQTFLACLLALVASGVLMMFMSIMLLAGVLASLVPSGESPYVKSNSILRIEFREEIVDTPGGSIWDDIDPYTFKITRKMALIDIIGTLEQAADDPDIKGIYLNLSPYMSMGLARLEEIRAELQRFKESGKFIVSYADYYTQSTYYLASVADKVFVNPEGGVNWQGMSSKTMFFKGALDKLGLHVQAIRAGNYKSAVEPFISDRMSKENREQTEELVNTIWNSIVTAVGESRDIEPVKLHHYATNLTAAESESAKHFKLVDSVMYADQVLEYLAELTGKKSGRPDFVSFSSYLVSPTYDISVRHKNKLAIIYAEGEIIDGKSVRGYVGSRTFAANLRAARRDKQIKAVVLRVNSPGGSALASDIIWREMELLRKEKPLVVSMGNYAASGGYYIAAPADAIMASKSTITGSIGVFGLMLDASDALKDKLGITFDGVKTNPSADIGSPFRKHSETELNYLQGRVGKVYDVFVDHVAKGRNLSDNYVREIGGGRVWSGVSAEEKGLVDYCGGLKEAILLAVDRAGIENTKYRLVSPLYSDDGISSLFGQFAMKLLSGDRQSKFDALRAEFDNIARVLERDEVQALMPYGVVIE